MNTQTSAKDFATDQDVRWCPGCGDYAILKAVRAALAKGSRSPHEIAFVSGIGCAARFPYYMNTFGFHTIHGRAPAVATGLKLANPDLDVWVVGGDGDLLAIGGNHLVHALRRNIDIKILLFNNAIYGLTKGQASPASTYGTISPTSPRGSRERPTNAALLALASGATFVARAVDTDVTSLTEILEQASAHRGTAFVEIFQNCIVFNDGVWNQFSTKKTRKDGAVNARHGKPLRYGNANDKGLRWNTATSAFDIVEAIKDPESADITVFDEQNFMHAAALARMMGDDFPTALGVIYRPRVEDVQDLSHRPVAGPLSAASLQGLLDGPGGGPKARQANTP